MKLSKTEKTILLDLFKASNGLFLFTLHRQSNLSPKEIFIAIENLLANKLIELTDDRVTATKEGIDFVIKNTIRNKADNDKKNLFIENFKGQRIEINSFYIPQDFNQ